MRKVVSKIFGILWFGIVLYAICNFTAIIVYPDNFKEYQSYKALSTLNMEDVSRFFVDETKATEIAKVKVEKAKVNAYFTYGYDRVIGNWK